MSTNTTMGAANMPGPAHVGSLYNLQMVVATPLPAPAAVPVRETLDLDHEPRERLEKALAILSNYQLLMKYATENKQVSHQASLQLINSLLIFVPSQSPQRGCTGRRSQLLVSCEAPEQCEEWRLWRAP